MATTIQLKRSTDATSAPSLAYGELAYSYEASTKKLWIGNSNGTAQEVGGNYFTSLFPANTTNGIAEDGKLVIVKSDGSLVLDGDLELGGNPITGVTSLKTIAGYVGENDGVGSAFVGATFARASSDLSTIDSNTNDGLKLSASTAGAQIILDAPGGIKSTTGIVDTDVALTANSDVKLASQKAIKHYVDNSASATSNVGVDDTKAVFTDAGGANYASTIKLQLDGEDTAELTHEGLKLAADQRTTESLFDLELQSYSTLTTDGGQASALTMRENGGVSLARITGSHYGTAADDRGKLIFQTQPIAGSATASDATLQNVLTLDANAKVTVHGDLEVVGSTTTVNSETITVEDNVLVLGGAFGEIATFTATTGGAGTWTNGDHLITATTDGAGTGAKFRVVVTGGTTFTVTMEDGGTGHTTTDSLTLAGIGGGSANDIPVAIDSVVSTGPADDSLDRGIGFSYGVSGTKYKAFFGMRRSNSGTGRFGFVPQATNTSNDTYGGTLGDIEATAFYGALTGNVTGNVSGTADTVTNATQASITTTANLTTVGALDSGSITSGFGAIDNGTDNITTGGIVSIDVDGGAGAAGSLSFGATGGAADAEMYFNGTNFNLTTGGKFNVISDGLEIVPDATAGVGQKISLLHSIASTGVSNPSFELGAAAAEKFGITTTFTAGNKLSTVKFSGDTAVTGVATGSFEMFPGGEHVWSADGSGLVGQNSSNTTYWDANEGTVNVNAPSAYTYKDQDGSTDVTVHKPLLDNFIINCGFFAAS